MKTRKALLILALLMAAPALSCVMAAQVAVNERDLQVPPKLRTAEAVVDAAQGLAELAVDAATIEAITPYSIPGIGTITAGTHATAKHAEAERVRERLAQPNTECHDCEDGRRRCFNTSGNLYALGVYVLLRGTWVEITAFECDEDYLEQMLFDCDGSGYPNAKYAG